MTAVVDASVVLAWLQGEPGAEEAEPADAEIAAQLWHRGTTLSLADRLCLALGHRLELPVAIADAACTAVEGGPAVVLLR